MMALYLVLFWRPDWPKIYKDCSIPGSIHPDVANALLSVTRETLRLSLSAIEYQQSQDAYHNFAHAADELRRVLGQTVG
jgi:hypothetical protein